MVKKQALGKKITRSFDHLKRYGAAIKRKRV
jgi:hypothetical protein